MSFLASNFSFMYTYRFVNLKLISFYNPLSRNAREGRWLPWIARRRAQSQAQDLRNRQTGTLSLKRHIET